MRQFAPAAGEAGVIAFAGSLAAAWTAPGGWPCRQEHLRLARVRGRQPSTLHAARLGAVRGQQPGRARIAPGRRRLPDLDTSHPTRAWRRRNRDSTGRSIYVGPRVSRRVWSTSGRQVIMEPAVIPAPITNWAAGAGDCHAGARSIRPGRARAAAVQRHEFHRPVERHGRRVHDKRRRWPGPFSSITRPPSRSLQAAARRRGRSSRSSPPARSTWRWPTLRATTSSAHQTSRPARHGSSSATTPDDGGCCRSGRSVQGPDQRAAAVQGMTRWVYVPAPPAQARLTARVSHPESPPVRLGPHQAQPDA